METWKILNQVIKRSKRNSVIGEIIDNNRNITDKHVIANKFNTYFTNIGSNLASKIKHVKSSHYDFLTGNYVNSMFFNPITEFEILDIMNSLRNSTSKGHDNTTTNIAKK